MKKQMMKLVDKFGGVFTVAYESGRKYNPYCVYFTYCGERSLIKKYADMESAVRFVHDIYVGKITF